MSKSKPKLVRITTVPISMNIILKGQLEFMNKYFEVVGVTGYDEKHFNDCRDREGIRMEVVEMSRTINIIKDIKSLILLYFLFRREKPQIVHSHTPKAGLLGMLAAQLARVPIRLHTVGGMPLTEAKGVKRKLLNFIERLTYHCAHKVYPNSSGLKDIILVNRFCSESKLKVIGNGGSNGVDTDYFNSEILINQGVSGQLRHDLGIDNDDFVFCFVGRIAKEKGILELIQAFDKLKNRIPHRKVKLLLIGPFEKHYGVLTDDIQQEILRHPGIIAPGRFDDVRPYYLIGDVYVFPSYREGFPNTLLEAGSMGLPSIVTDINGCNEIIQNRLNGLIIPPKDSNALFEAMLEIAEDDMLCQSLRANARPHIEKHFKRELVWNQLLAEYQKFMNK